LDPSGSWFHIGDLSLTLLTWKGALAERGWQPRPDEPAEFAQSFSLGFLYIVLHLFCVGGYVPFVVMRSPFVLWLL